jgi:hypothetical protein
MVLNFAQECLKIILMVLNFAQECLKIILSRSQIDSSSKSTIYKQGFPTYK